MKRLLNILVCIACCACTPSSVWKQLDCSAQLMNDRADSALCILKSIDYNRLHSAASRARFALLYSQALDKNYIDLTTDSLLQPALRYYNSGRGTAHDRMLANYLMGRIHYNAGEYGHAMAAFLVAEEDSKEVNNPNLCGLLYAYKGFLHGKFYDYHSSIKAYDQADSCFLLAQNTKLHKHTLLNIAHGHMNLKEYNQSESQYINLLNTAISEQDTALGQTCMEFLLTQYINQQAYAKANLLLARTDIKIDTTTFLYIMALAQIKAAEGKINDAENLILQARKQASNSRDISRVYFTQYRHNQILGNYEEALENYITVAHIQDTIMRRVLRQPLIATQRDFYRAQSALRTEQIQHARLLYGAMFAIAVLGLGIVIILARHRIAAKKAEVGQYIGLLDELREKTNAETHEMNMQISKLFADQFSLLNQLSTIYYETHALQKDKEAIYKKVREEIGYWSDNRKHQGELEKVVNTYKNNVLAVIRKEIPSFSELDMQILCYWYAGFSTKAISVFLANTISMINTRKHRLRSKMIQLNPPSLALMLKKLP